MLTERTTEQQLRQRLHRVRERVANITGINLNTPYPFAAPALGGFAGGIAGYGLGRRYDIPDYLTVPAGFLAGMTAGSTINRRFAYDNDKTSALRTRLMVRRFINERGYCRYL